jgi:hypothetical protein
MNAGSIAGARPRSRPSIAGPPRVVSINNIAIAVVVKSSYDNGNRVRSNSISTVVTSNKKRQLHTISPTNATTTTTSTTTILSNEQQLQKQKAEQKRKMLLNIHPTDYAKAGFKANGYKDFDIIINDSIKRFIIKPSPEMTAAYSTDIVMAVRTNNVEKARELYKQDYKFIHGCNACNCFGESILHIACRRGHMNMVKFLIEEVGLRVDTIRDDYHRTPLHDAFWTPIASYDVVDFLLRQPNVVQLLLLKDVRGYTPLDYARSEDRGKWLRFLWERKSILHPTGLSLSSSCTSTSTPTSLSSTSTPTSLSSTSTITPSLSNTTSTPSTSLSNTTSTTTSSSIIVPSTKTNSATTMKEDDVDTDTDIDNSEADDTDTDDDITVTTTTTTPAITTAVVIEQQQQELLSTTTSSSSPVFDDDVNNKRQRLCG